MQQPSSVHRCMKSCGLLALRIAIAIIFIYSGYTKLANHGMIAGMFGSLGLVPAGFLAWFVGAIELVGGIMILLGVFAGYAALPLAIIMVVAMVTAHRGGPFNGYFLPLSLFGGLLALIGTGAGKYRLVKKECHCKGCNTDGNAGGCCGGNGECACQKEQPKK